MLADNDTIVAQHGSDPHARSTTGDANGVETARRQVADKQDMYDSTEYHEYLRLASLCEVEEPPSLVHYNSLKYRE